MKPVSKKPATDSSKPEDPKLGRERAIASMEKKLKKTAGMTPSNIARHRAVLAMMYVTRSRGQGDTREGLALSVAKTFNRGEYFARRLVHWENLWIQNGLIPEDNRGRHATTKSWLTDEGVQLEIRKQVATMKEGQLTDMSAPVR